jgi:hypothetical protein
MWDMFWSGKQPAVSLFGTAPVMAEDFQAKPKEIKLSCKISHTIDINGERIESSKEEIFDILLFPNLFSGLIEDSGDAKIFSLHFLGLTVTHHFSNPRSVPAKLLILPGNPGGLFLSSV